MSATMRLVKYLPDGGMPRDEVTESKEFDKGKKKFWLATKAKVYVEAVVRIEVPYDVDPNVPGQVSSDTHPGACTELPCANQPARVKGIEEINAKLAELFG